jgi:hypothetical protein
MKTIQQIIDEERKKTGIAELSNHQVAVSVANAARYRSDEENSRIAESNKLFRQNHPVPEERKQRIAATLRGKTLEEILGEERAAEGRKKRSEAHKGKTRPKEVGQKISEVRRANGSYDGRSMLGKEHKESTKATMAIKAKVRQELKRELGLGRDGKIPKELLEARYKQLGM